MKALSGLILANDIGSPPSNTWRYRQSCQPGAFGVAGEAGGISVESRSFDLEEVFTRFIKHAIILACGLVPICLIGYILFFADQKLIFKNFLVHEIIILMAVTWSGFITYIFYLCYAKTRETFLRYMALAFLG
ncbi:MAG: hypothetical protein QGF09_13745, partial [Rhodospirillales bacterium]|nr:hypothetical protein [Rhodospirillales bacterium]